jgi:hypothetical protein
MPSLDDARNTVRPVLTESTLPSFSLGDPVGARMRRPDGTLTFR